MMVLGMLFWAALLAVLAILGVLLFVLLARGRRGRSAPFAAQILGLGLLVAAAGIAALLLYGAD